MYIFKTDEGYIGFCKETNRTYYGLSFMTVIVGGLNGAYAG